MVVEIIKVLKRLNRTKNYVRHMVVFATWWSSTLSQYKFRQRDAATDIAMDVALDIATNVATGVYIRPKS